MGTLFLSNTVLVNLETAIIDGQDLSAEIIPGEPWQESDVINLLREILEVLAFVHQQNIIHRDIKPQNLMRRRADRKIVLIDFGAVKEVSAMQVTSQGNTSLTVGIGTPGYMPDEQAAGKPKLSSDVYAVGMLGIQALTGLSPSQLREDPRTGEVMWRSCAQVEVNDALANVLDTMVKPFFSQRYPSAVEAMQALTTVLAAQTTSQATTIISPPSVPPTIPHGSSPQLTETNATISQPSIPSVVPPDPQPSPVPVTIPQKSPHYPISKTIEQPIKPSAVDEELEKLKGISPPQSPVQAKTSPSPSVPNRRKFIAIAVLGGMGYIGAVIWGNTPQKSPASPLSLNSFSFEVVTVNARGEIANRSNKQAQFFAEDLGSGITLDMVAIPGGKFIMGSPATEKDRYSDEGPQREVSIQPFSMGKFAVTQAQWQAVMGNNPSDFKGDKRPIERITWHQAREFCRKLSQQTGRQYRLPSEAEWEYACRAGTTTPFYFGETITPAIVNYNGNFPYGEAPKGQFRQQTTDVGSFPPNAFGLYDMHGNVWEWCEDVWHENYNGAPTDGSAWETKGNENDNRSRPLRGGSWNFKADACRSADRYPFTHDWNYIGFRVVASL
jgi:eukaryotic-like serine/threonine-protein kinase